MVECFRSNHLFCAFYLAEVNKIIKTMGGGMMINNIKQYFNFKNKLDHSVTMIKIVDGKIIDRKLIKGDKKIYFLPFLFTFLYPIFTRKYRTKGFAKDMWTLFALSILLSIFETIVGEGILHISPSSGTLILNSITCVLFGTMFATWFRDRLIKNGYVEEGQSNLDQQTKENLGTPGTMRNEDKGIICDNCGALNPAGNASKFCTNCGAPLNAQNGKNLNKRKKGRKNYLIWTCLGLIIAICLTFKLWMPLVPNTLKSYFKPDRSERYAPNKNGKTPKKQGEKSVKKESKTANSISKSSETNEGGKVNDNSNEKMGNEIFQRLKDDESFKSDVANIADSGGNENKTGVTITLLKNTDSNSFVFDMNGKREYIVDVRDGGVEEKYGMNAENYQVVPFEGGPVNIPDYKESTISTVIPYSNAIDKDY